MNQSRERLAITQHEIDVLALIVGHVQAFNRRQVVDLDLDRTKGMSLPGDLVINAMIVGNEPRRSA